MTSALNAGHDGHFAPEGISVYDVVGACVSDPDRWAEAAEAQNAGGMATDASKAICRTCPRRWLCARDAVETPGAEGLWAGIVIPESGRPRTFALKQLRSLAERGGYPVRKGRRRFVEPQDPPRPETEPHTGAAS